MRLIQFVGPDKARAVGVVEADAVREVNGVDTIRQLAMRAIAAGRSLEDQVRQLGLAASHDYDELISGGKILPPLDHPDAPHVMIAGTGLTHIGLFGRPLVNPTRRSKTRIQPGAIRSL